MCASKQSKKTGLAKKAHLKSRHHRCRYTFVINEMDTSDCPTVSSSHEQRSRSVNENSHHDRQSSVDMQQSQPSDSVVWSLSQQAYLNSLQGLQHDLKQLEDSIQRQKDFTHKLEYRILLQDQRLTKQEHGSQLTWANFTGLTDQMRRLTETLEWQKDQQRSLDRKVSGLMLDMAELTAQMAEQTQLATSSHDGVGLAGQGYKPGKARHHKRLYVESTSQITACQHLPNATKFHGKNSP